MENREHYLKAFLVAGLLIGVLSAIPVLNCCCCLWVVMGGGLAAYILCQAAEKPVKPGEGALVGLFSGLIGGMIFSLAQALQQAINGNLVSQAFEEGFRQGMQNSGVGIPPEMEDMIHRMMEMFTNPGLLLGLALFFSLIIFAIMAMLGAVAAVSIFEPRFAMKRAVKAGTFYQQVPCPGTAPGQGASVSRPVQPLKRPPEIRSEEAGFAPKSMATPDGGAIPAPGDEELEIVFPRKPKEED